MAERTSQVDILIGGKVYHLSVDDPEYLQKVAGYLNRKIAECKASGSYRGFDAEYRELFLNLNIADDYFKAEKENSELKKQVEELEKELYSIRHDAVSTKMKLENSLKQQEVLEERVRELKEHKPGYGRNY